MAAVADAASRPATRGPGPARGPAAAAFPVWRWVILLLAGAVLPDPALRGAASSPGLQGVRPGLQPGRVLRRAHPVAASWRVITTVITLVLMVPTTVYVHLRLPRLRRLMEAITILPIVIPPVVLIVGVLEVAPGFLKGTPYLLGAGVRRSWPCRSPTGRSTPGCGRWTCKTLVDASSSLGAGWPTTLWRVILPNLRTALLSATVLTVALVLGEFTMASLDLYQTFPVWIVNFDQTSGPVSVAASLLALFVTWIFLHADRDTREPGGRGGAAAARSPCSPWCSATSGQADGRVGDDDRTPPASAADRRPRRRARPAGGAPVSLPDLSRAFGAVRALDRLSLEIAPGELVALLGPSGCGKTTALRILAGFETADSGSVTVDGKDISPVPAAKRDMGMVFQSYSLFPNMTALDNVGFGLRMRKHGRRPSASRRAGELLDMVGLAAQARQYPHQLSGGQQQRVALARALAIEPRVLLLDEPLSALDAKVRLQLREQIRAVQQRLGTTTLFVTHDQEEALSMADRVGVMRDGRLEQIAVPGRAVRAARDRVRGRVRRHDEPDPRRARSGQARSARSGATVPVQGERPTGWPATWTCWSGRRGCAIAAVPNGNGIVTDRTFLGSVTRVSVRLSGDVHGQGRQAEHEAAGAAARHLGPGDPARRGRPGRRRRRPREPLTAAQRSGWSRASRARAATAGWSPADGEQHVGPGRAGRRAACPAGWRRVARPLLVIAHLSDTHVMDHQSPGRVELLDRYSDPDSPLRAEVGIIGTYRAQELFTFQVAEAMVRAVREHRRGAGVRRARSTSPSSPATPPTTASATSCAPTSTCWTAATSRGPTPATRSGTRASPARRSTDERYWHPDAGRARPAPDRVTASPRVPGVLDAVRRPFRAAGPRAALVRGARQPRQHAAGHRPARGLAARLPGRRGQVRHAAGRPGPRPTLLARFEHAERRRAARAAPAAPSSR